MIYSIGGTVFFNVKFIQETLRLFVLKQTVYQVFLSLFTAPNFAELMLVNPWSLLLCEKQQHHPFYREQRHMGQERHYGVYPMTDFQIRTVSLIKKGYAHTLQPCQTHS